MAKTMCSWEKGKFKDTLEIYKKIVRNPEYYCKKCGRVAKDEKHLCKPEKL